MGRGEDRIFGVVMTHKLRVLILEDEFFTTLELIHLVEEVAHASVVAKHTLSGAVEVLDQPFDLALLDVNLVDGRSYEIARTMAKHDVPFVFVSASSPAELPEGLAGSPFISKPFRPEEIKQAVLAAKDHRPLV
jgi:CheY-like chemotaxis protein